MTGDVTRAGTYPTLASRYDFWPSAWSEGSGAVIGLAFDADRRPASPDTHLDVIAAILSLALGAGRSQT